MIADENVAEEQIIREQIEDQRLAEMAVAAAREDLLAFCLLMNPDFIVGPHHRLMADQLMAVFRGDIKRLMIFISPRSTKSLMSSTYFPAWCLGKIPQWQIMSVSYSSELASGFGRDVRNLVQSEQFRAVFPYVELRPDSRASGRWHTNAGGVYTSAGITGGIAGRGANLAIIDDPLSEQDAYSKANRDHVIRWYPGGLRTRLMPNGRIIVIMTRWHEEDLAGWLLSEQERNPAADKWTVIRIPAILDEESCEELRAAEVKLIRAGIYPIDAPPLQVGESYWPVIPENATKDTGLRGWSTEELIATKENTPPYQWSALYMQSPTIDGGNILRDKWWKVWSEREPPTCEYILQSYDTAFSTATHADLSAVTTWGVFKDNNGVPNLICLGMKKGRWEYPELRRMAMDLYDYHKPDGVLIEKKASGQSLIQDLRLAGVPVIEYTPDKDKISRAHAASPLLQGGRIWVPDKAWADELIHECAQFPNGPHDDVVDTVTQAILWLKSGVWVIHPDDPWNFVSDYDKMPDKKRRYYY